MTHGTLPSRRYNRAWLTQRLLNRAPEWTRARRSPVSIAQQLVNPLALEVQETMQALAHERNNAHLATCDLTLPDHAWKVELPGRFEFRKEDDPSSYPYIYPPKVIVEINGENTEITLAEKNNVQTLFYEALPTRIEYANQQLLWDEVIPPTLISDLHSVSPIDLSFEGPIYITVQNNTVWEKQFRAVLYRSKIYLKGKDLFDNPITEVIPIRLNGTYKTRQNWTVLDEIFVAHMDENATITVECLPFTEEEVLDSRTIAIDNDGTEQYQYYQLKNRSWGSTLVGTRFIVGDLDQVRMGLSDKATNLELELLNNDEENIEARAFVLLPWTNYAYVVDNNYFYVYDYSVPFPNIEGLRNDTGDNRISVLFPDNPWMCTRGDEFVIQTKILDLSTIPTHNRWTITFPDGEKYRLDTDGNLWPLSVDGWIYNESFGDGEWKEQRIAFNQVTQTGAYVVEFEGKYLQEDQTFLYRTTKELFFVPAITPETQIPLPAQLWGAKKIGFDMSGQLWFYNGTSLLKTKVFHDYFMADFQDKTIWLREQYRLVKVIP